MPHRIACILTLLSVSCAPESASAVTGSLLELAAGEPPTHRAKITLTNDGDAPAVLDDWALYFNSMRPLDTGVERVEGQLFRGTPPKGTTLPPKVSMDVEIGGTRWPIYVTDAPSGFSGVAGGEPHPVRRAAVALPAELLRDDTIDNRLRLPVPGARIVGGVLHASVAYPGLTLDGTMPTAESPVYERPVDVGPHATIRIAAFDRRGRAGRAAEVE